MQHLSYNTTRQSSTHMNSFNYNNSQYQRQQTQNPNTNYQSKQIRMSMAYNNEFKRSKNLRVRNVSMETKKITQQYQYNKSSYKFNEYYNIQTPKYDFKENKFSGYKNIIQTQPQKNQNECQKYNCLQTIQRNSQFNYQDNDQPSYIHTQKQINLQTNKVQNGQKINLSIESTDYSNSDTYSNQQKLLDDIKQKFKQPKKISDLLDYLSNEFNSNFIECDSINENTLLSSEQSTQEKFYSNTADSFYSQNKKQNKFSLINRTYSQQNNYLKNSSKFDLQFYSVFEKLNPRKYNKNLNEDFDNNDIKFNEYKTKIDYIDTQKLIDEVKQTLSQKNVGYYLKQLKQKQLLSNQFQQMNLNDQNYLFQGLYRFIPKDADELFTWNFFDKYRVENYLPFFNNPFVSNVKTTWIMNPNSRFPHTYQYIIKRSICHDQFEDFTKFIKKVNINKPIDFENNLTPLQLAAKLNKVLALKYLIMIGADLNVQNKYGNTALMEALNETSFDCIKQLVQNGAKIDIKDNYGIDVIEKANIKNYNSIQGYLEENLQQKTYPLQRTIQRPQYIKDCILILKLINKSQVQKYGRPLNYPFNDLRKNYLISFLNKIDF